MGRAFHNKLRDVHAPARFFEREIHWQMACGPDAVDAVVTATALHLLGPNPLPAYLDAFEEHRAFLCELAAQKYALGLHDRTRVSIDSDDIVPLIRHSEMTATENPGAGI
jgi:hypothetical protein